VLVFDAAGLAVFCVSGTAKALAYHLGPIEAIALGTLTGVGGGILRDVLANEQPAVRRAGSQLYAVPAVLGSAIIVVVEYLHLYGSLATGLAAVFVFVVRIGALRYGWQAPQAYRGNCRDAAQRDTEHDAQDPAQRARWIMLPTAIACEALVSASRCADMTCGDAVRAALSVAEVIGKAAERIRWQAVRSLCGRALGWRCTHSRHRVSRRLTRAGRLRLRKRGDWADAASRCCIGTRRCLPMRAWHGMAHKEYEAREQDMAIRVCVAGATGWTGSAVTRHILSGMSSPDPDFALVGAVARQLAGRDIGEALGLPAAGISIVSTVKEALQTPTDVLIDYTHPTAVKAHALTALGLGVRVVIGTSGLTTADYDEIDRVATERGLGVIAAGNFSITAALAKRFALMAARYVPSWELIDYADAGKIDAPSGTVRELAEELAQVARPQMEVPVEEVHGDRMTRGSAIEGTQVHAIRLPGYVISFEAVFGLPDERLTLRHDAGAGAGPYVGGTLLAARNVMQTTGLIRGLDRLLFEV